ncbi:MAG: TRAP transporter small permease [Chloroflexota bacterium]
MKLTRLGRIFDRVNNVLASVAGFLVLVIMLLTCYQVITRYFLHNPPHWGIEVMQYMLFIFPFLGAAWLLRRQGHVRVDIVFNFLNTRSQTRLNIVSSSVGAIACFIITWFGAVAAWTNYSQGIMMTEGLVFPKFILFLFIPLGCSLLSLEFARQAVNHAASLRASAPKK